MAYRLGVDVGGTFTDVALIHQQRLVLAKVSTTVPDQSVGVVEAEGMTVDRGDEPAAHARRALHWSRYARGPVNALHRCCAVDITRGSLRLLDQPESGR